MRTTSELWHQAGRAARDDRKRFLALQGILWSGPLLVLGAIVARLPSPDLPAIRAPVRYVLEPLEVAWRGDQDLSLIGYVGLQFLLLALLWGLFGGAIHRLAAVDLTQRRREEGRAALAFARKHWRAFVGARVALWLGVAVPLLAAVAVASLGRLPGWVGGIFLALAVAAAVLLSIAAVIVLFVHLLAGILTGPTVATEDSDAFDAVGRTFTYAAAAGLPRLLGLRLLFALRVLLGTLWNLLRTLAVAGLAYLCLHVGAGDRVLDGALAIVGAMGVPPDAERLGLEPYHYLVAGVLAVAVGSLVIVWAADAISRICCAREAVYLLLRREVDRVPLSALRTAPRTRRHQSAEEAGFVEVGRIGDG